MSYFLLDASLSLQSHAKAYIKIYLLSLNLTPFKIKKRITEKGEKDGMKSKPEIFALRVRLSKRVCAPQSKFRCLPLFLHLIF